jgi:hypothetical protein
MSTAAAPSSSCSRRVRTPGPCTADASSRMSSSFAINPSSSRRGSGGLSSCGRLSSGGCSSRRRSWSPSVRSPLSTHDTLACAKSVPLAELPPAANEVTLARSSPAGMKPGCQPNNGHLATYTADIPRRTLFAIALRMLRRASFPPRRQRDPWLPPCRRRFMSRSI